MSEVKPGMHAATGVNTVPVKKDALNRAVRTFFQGLLIDLTATVGVIIAMGAGDIHWTKEWWYGFFLLIGKTVVAGVVSYIARLMVKPKGAVQ